MFFKPNIEKMKEKRDVKGLKKALRNKDVLIRAKAARALGELKDESAVEDLIEALQDESLDVRKSAIWALSNIGNARAVEALVRVLKEEDATLKVEAARALKELSTRKTSEVVQAISAAFNISREASEKLLKTGLSVESISKLPGLPELSGLARKLLKK